MNVGDTLTIKIGEVIKTDRRTLYRIEGFNTLVLDDYACDIIKGQNNVEAKKPVTGTELIAKDGHKALVIEPMKEGIRILDPITKEVFIKYADLNDYKIGRQVRDILNWYNLNGLPRGGES